MRVKITVLYDDDTMTKNSKNYDLPTQDEDEGSFQEVVDYLTENLVEPYADDGYELEPDEEVSLGKDYAAVWVIAEPFDTREDAKEFVEQFISDANLVLADLE